MRSHLIYIFLPKLKHNLIILDDTWVLHQYLPNMEPPLEQRGSASITTHKPKHAEPPPSWQIKSIKTSLINETAVMVHQLKDAPGECF